MKRLYPILLLIGIFILTFALFFHPITDFSQDLGRHIKLGNIILATGKVPTTNLFSYTYPNFPFINHHWFSEVIFALLFNTTDVQGLLFVMSFVAAASMTIIVLQTIQKNYFAAIFSGVCFVSILYSRAYLRPEIFSFFFLSIFMSVLYINRQRATKFLYLLPFLELLWVNMHIYFIIGPLVVGLFLFEECVMYVHNKHDADEKTIEKKRIFHLAAVFAATCLVTICNPNGIAGALYPFYVFNNYGYAIQENQSLFFLAQIGLWNPMGTLFIWVVVVLFLLFIILWKKTNFIDWLLFILFSIMAETAVRNFSLFVFAVFIPASRLLGNIIQPFEKVFKAKMYVAEIIIIVISLFMLLSVAHETNGFGFNVASYPKDAADFFLKNHLQGPIFNDFDIGSYLDYRLYPKEHVFVDGRPEAYPASFIQNIYILMQKDPAVFAKEDAIYHFQTIFFAHNDQTPWAKTFLNWILHQQAAWKLVYVDGEDIILVRNNDVNKRIPEITEKDFLAGKIIYPSDVKGLMQMAQIFDMAGWLNTEIIVLQKAFSINPHLCFIPETIANIFHTLRDPQELLYNNISSTCQK
ncbi:MAG: hypothetical protein ACREGI_00940 [Candidatus Levyibacteriota bacterium]